MKYDSVVYADPMPNWIVVDVERYGLFYSVMDRAGEGIGIRQVFRVHPSLCESGSDWVSRSNSQSSYTHTHSISSMNNINK